MYDSLLNSSTLINYSSVCPGSEIDSHVSVEYPIHLKETNVVSIAAWLRGRKMLFLVKLTARAICAEVAGSQSSLTYLPI